MPHTPGPWEVRGDFYIGRAHKMSLAEVVSSDSGSLAVVKCGDVPHDDIETHKANARLIAAAPTMYNYIVALANQGDSDAKAIIASIGAS